MRLARATAGEVDAAFVSVSIPEILSKWLGESEKRMAGLFAEARDKAPALEEIGSAIRNHGVTTLWLTAGLFNAMVDARLEDLRPLHQLLAGGDVLSVAHVRKALRALPETRLINGYGPTESTTFACCYTIDPNGPRDEPIPIGKPIANTSAYILDAQLQPVAIGQTGELFLGGDGLARGIAQPRA